MKAGTYILYFLLAIASLSFKMTSKNSHIEEVRDLAISIID